MKKLFVIILTAVALACMALSAAAADPVVSVTTPDVVRPGDEFTVTVNIAGDISYLAAYARPVFNEDIFTLVGGEWLVDGKLSDFDATLGDGVIFLSEVSKARGAVFRFTLRANKNIAAGETSIGCKFIISESTGDLIEFISSGRNDVDVEVSGVAVFVTVTSYNPQNEVKIELVQDGNVLYTTTVPATDGTGSVTQEFAIDAVAPGTYTMVVSKSKHATREYTVVVADADLEKDVEIWMYGDVYPGDKRLSMVDATQIQRYLSGKSSIFGSTDDAELEAYRLKVADVYTGDGRISMVDVTQIQRYLSGKASIYDSIS